MFRIPIWFNPIKKIIQNLVNGMKILNVSLHYWKGWKKDVHISFKCNLIHFEIPNWFLCKTKFFWNIKIDQITFQMGVYTLEMKVKIGQEVRLFCKPNSKQHILEKWLQRRKKDLVVAKRTIRTLAAYKQLFLGHHLNPLGTHLVRILWGPLVL